jgi:uncharacterized phage-associated protein
VASARDVARYFLAIQDEEAGELITNLKLQKLVYYGQGFHLAVYGRPLFDARIKAWAHGPVVPSLWHDYKHYGSSPIKPEPLDKSRLTVEQRKLLDEVYLAYGQFSAWRLREMTHHEPPWQKAFEGDGVIREGDMEAYFKTQLT